MRQHGYQGGQFLRSGEVGQGRAELPAHLRAELERHAARPARPGREDLVMLANEPATAEQPFAWTAAVLDGYVWFCLKNPADFPATLFWISNGGRHEAPWNGVHTKRLGLEEVCSYFCDDIADSRKDLLADLGIPEEKA